MLGLVEIRQTLRLESPLSYLFARVVEGELGRLLSDLYRYEKFYEREDVCGFRLIPRKGINLSWVGRKAVELLPKTNAYAIAPSLEWEYNCILGYPDIAHHVPIVGMREIRIYSCHTISSLLERLEKLRKENDYEILVGYLPLLIFTGHLWRRVGKVLELGSVFSKVYGGLAGKRTAVVGLCSNSRYVGGMSPIESAAITTAEEIAHLYGLKHSDPHSGPCLLSKSSERFCDLCLAALKSA